MDESIASASKAGTPVNVARGFLGAALGGVAGYFITGWLAGQNFYAMALPGMSIGLGAGLLVKERSRGLAIVCGLLALALGVFTEWKNYPFVADHSFDFFIRHLGDLQPLGKIMIGLGAVAGYWFALGAGRTRTAPAI